MKKFLVFVGGLITGVAAGVLAMKAGNDDVSEPRKGTDVFAGDADSASAEESELATSPEEPSDEEEQ
jgi:hypothetical protein